jgi:hypothetical protein
LSKRPRGRRLAIDTIDPSREASSIAEDLGAEIKERSLS